MKTWMQKTLTTLIAILVANMLSLAQIKILNSENTSAALELDTREAGLLIPRLTDAQRDAIKTPAEGLMVFNTTNEELNYWDGMVWKSVASSLVTTTTGSLTFNEGTAINTTGALAAPSAILDVQSTEKGLLLPRTNHPAVSNPANGLLIYSTSSRAPIFFDGSVWVAPCQNQVSANSASGSATAEGVVISESQSNADPSALLDIASESQGLLLPILSDAQRDQLNPAIGLIIFNPNSQSIQYYTSTGWYKTTSTIDQPSAIVASETSPWQFTEGVTYTVTNIPGVTYTWRVPDGWTITSGQGTHQITVTIGSLDGIIEVIPSNECGNGVSQVLEVDIKQGFVTTWNTTNTLSGGSTSKQISLQLYGNGYNFKIYWGDGSSQTHIANPGATNTHQLTKTYANPGIYTITITGNFPTLYTNFHPDRNKLIEINQWGDISWDAMISSFSGCENLTGNFTDTPDLTNVTDMSDMFRRCALFDGPEVMNWDVSNVTNMSYLFSDCLVFNSSVSDWDVSSVSRMDAMFADAESFNGSLKNWDVSNVTHMAFMFSGAKSFNSDISGWNTSSLEDVNYMFAGAESFNQTIGDWHMDLVTDMIGVFKNAKQFNADLSWTFNSEVTSLSEMFSGATLFNGNISGWDVSNIVNMSDMFNNASSFNQDISSWDVSSVANMNSMFENASSFNQNLENWCVQLFEYTPSNFDLEAISWTLPKPIWGTCPGPFITQWNTSNPGVSGSSSIRIPLFGDGYDFIVDWGDGNIEPYVMNPGNVAHHIEHTYSAPGIYSVSISGDFPRIYFADSGDKLKLIDIEQWGGSGVSWASFDQSFQGCQNLVITASDSPDLRNVNSINQIFDGCSNINPDLSKWDVSGITSMANAFNGASSFNSGLFNWDVQNVTNMEGMFQNAVNFNQSLFIWDISQVTNMDSMFYGAAAFNQDLSEWCVNNISAEPSGFAVGASSWVQPKPVWGSCPDRSFVTQWNTVNSQSGGSGSNQLAIPMYGNGYNCRIKWGDGQHTDYTWNSGETAHSVLHTYASPGIYTVSISGDFPRIYLAGGPESYKLLKIIQWGDIEWQTMEYAFAGAIAYENSTIHDNPDLSDVSNFSGMFYFSTFKHDGPLLWDVSSITDMSYMFSVSAFFSDISSWDVSSVTTMSNMFNNNGTFNQPIGNWDVSSVTDMSNMFSGSDGFFGNLNRFNQDISGWDVSSVVNMSNMFNGAVDFNQDLSGWCVTNIPTPPINFDLNTPSWTLPRPVWGTCP